MNFELSKMVARSVLGNGKTDSGREKQYRYKRPIFPIVTQSHGYGVYIAQYCSTVITYFFLTWFPVYLITEKQ